MLSKILSMEKKNISSVIIYGNLSEQIMSADLVSRPVIMHIHTLLKHNGFDNIIFYDATHAIGKFVKDDASAVYSFNGNQKSYIKKYGSLPKGMLSNTGEQPISAAASDDDVFGKLGTVVDDNNAAEQQFQNEQIQWSEPNMELIPFFEEMDKYMRNTSFRTCIVFTNLYDIIKNAGDNEFIRRLSYKLNFEYENGTDSNGNLIVFLQPDINDQKCLNEFTDALTISSLRDKFMICNKNGDESSRGAWKLDEERCFSFGVPDADEIEWLLTKERLKGTLDFEDTAFNIANKLNYMLRESYERAKANNMNVRPTSLADLIERIGNIVQKSGERFIIDDDNLSQFCCMPINFETAAREKMKNTKGWEGVYSKIEYSIDKFLTLNPEYKRTDELSPEEKEKYIYIPCRLHSRSMNNYPTVDILPSFMIPGPPGVGKTTIVRLMGRIFADAHMLRSGHVVCARASDIISDHIGGTARQVTELFDRAENGILFIDEAYGLYSDPNDRSSGNFKRDAIDAIVQAMTDNSRHVIVVFAGYPNSKPDSTDGVEALFRCNAGLRSRVKDIIYLNEYSASLLAEITMNRFLNNKAGITVDKSITMEGLEMVYEKKLRTRNKKTFGNARDAIAFADDVINNAVVNKRRVIMAEDFPNEYQKLVVCQKESFDEIIRMVNEQYPGGLGNIAGRIAKEIACRIKSARKRKKKALKKQKEKRSMIFTGRPGSGKTTIAKLIPKLLGTLGIMSGTEAVIITNPADCTPQELQDKIDQAVTLNTVLFIDEAYSLREDTVTALLSPMTDESLELVVIFALYEKEYDDFIKKNDGLESRCDHYSIDDYTPSQLIDIFKRMCSNIGYGYSDELVREEDNLGLLFRNWYDTREVNDSYANARDVEQLITKMGLNCDMRNEDSDDDAEYILTVQDIPGKYMETIEVLRKNADLKTVLAEFDNYYGFDKLRSVVTSISNTNKVDRIFEKFYNKKPDFSIGHFAFVGGSGTGKTTAGELFAKALYSVGLLKTPKFTKLLAGDLIAGYVGQTAGKTREKLNEGRYGVILIDEAYHLMVSDETANGDSFKKDAVNELLVFLEQEMGKTVVIFCGYKEPIQKMIESHEGLSSRVTNIIDFDSYNEDECFDIFKLMLSKKDPGYVLDTDAEEVCRERIRERIAAADFSNARDMRTLADRAVTGNRERMKKYIDEQREDEVTKEIFITIKAEDL